MFENEMTYITLSGREFPIRCDIKVLEQIQEKYKDLAAFEDLIYAFTPALDKNGKPEKDKEGNIVGHLGIPDVKAVNDALYFMVSEGLEVAGEDTVTRDELLSYVDASPIDVGKALQPEYDKCFKRKNLPTTQKKATGKN